MAPPAPAPQPNRFPTEQQPPATQHLVRLHPYDYDISQAGKAFVDPDGDPLTLEIKSPDPLPAGIEIVGTHIRGVPTVVRNFEIVTTVTDGRGGILISRTGFEITENSTPVLAPVAALKLTTVGATIDEDLSRGGTAASDADGDPVSYRAVLSAVPHGLTASGGRVTGRFDAVGAVRITLVASDPYGASSSATLVLAAPAPRPAPPVLPVTSYVYDDFKLPLPEAYLGSRQVRIPFWDTTPPNNPTTDAGATLGRVLFYDKRLSSTNTHSCGSCHHQSQGFADSTRFSLGATSEPTRRNAMPLGNARYNVHDLYFSDFRTSRLETLALQPILEPTELANTLPNLVATISAEPFYAPLFAAAFGTAEVTPERIAMAISQFVRSLITYQAKLDTAYPDGSGTFYPQESAAFTAQENEGLNLFLEGKCAFCHGDRVMTLDNPSDNGLDAVPPDGATSVSFRVSSLRNIAKTAPYMHDGRFATLRDVIDHYDHGIQASPSLSGLLQTNPGGGLPAVPRKLNLTEAQKDALEAFMNTFTDNHFLQDPKFSDPFP